MHLEAHAGLGWLIAQAPHGDRRLRASVPALALVFKRTPLEAFSPALDDRIVNLFFRKRTLVCAERGRKTNEVCSASGRPICRRHGRLTRRFAVKCPSCEA